MNIDFRGKTYEAYVTKFDYATPNRVEITLDGKIYVVTNRVGQPDKGVSKEELKDFALGILFKLEPINVAGVEFEGPPIAKTEITLPLATANGTVSEATVIVPKTHPYVGPKIVATGKGVKK